MSGTPAESATDRSPYELVLGDAIEGLHPRLRAYFGAISRGHHGVGSGVFATVGTPRRWLWPILGVLGWQGVLFPGWQHDVPFTVHNHPVVDAHGRTAVEAVRRFEFGRGGRDMVDAITAEPGGLVDHLGLRRRYVARLDVEVVDGMLRMRSTRLAVRLGSLRLGIPRAISPAVTLSERFDDATGTQHVAVAIDAPLLGRLYEYAGEFSYEIRPGETSE